MRSGMILKLLLLVLLIQGCITPAARKPTPEQAPVWQAETLAYEELFDPAQLIEPAWEVEESDYLLEMEIDPEQVEATQDSLIYGFRVQIVSTRILEEVQEVQRQALLLFGDEGVYYEYKSPLYRVRVGNCPDRKSAGRLLQRSRALGFQNAWIVQSLIKVAPAE
jgi:hypothetical protein